MKLGFLQAVLPTIPTPDPLGVLDKMMAAQRSWGLCARCANALLDDMKAHQERVWDALPEMFGLV